MSDLGLPISSVEDLKANGFSVLLTPSSQNVLGNGLWEPCGAFKGECCNGTIWRIIIKRPLTTEDSNEIRFKPSSSFRAAFAVWNGSKGERHGMKGISTWFTPYMPN
ncbi:MAG: hypothetical protein OEW33_13745 [Nitrospirota bacterium]|nr:hypothetical protein [Nitrospirota bacterium]